MIEFQLDETSGIATYVQLVQQVHQALRMGMLEPGDQLSTAQQAVAKLVINPHTVHKCYAALRVADHLRLGAWLNPGGDEKLAQRRIGELDLDPKQRAGTLSGGQRA